MSTLASTVMGFSHGAGWLSYKSSYPPRRDPEAVAAAIARSEQRFQDAGSLDAAELVREDRERQRWCGYFSTLLP